MLLLSFGVTFAELQGISVCPQALASFFFLMHSTVMVLRRLCFDAHGRHNRGVLIVLFLTCVSYRNTKVGLDCSYIAVVLTETLELSH